MSLNLLAAFAMIPLFLWCDRDVGDGAEGGLSRSGAMALAIIGGGLLAYLAFGSHFIATGALWAGLRSIGFKDGTLAPATASTKAAVAFRYALWVPLAIQAAWLGETGDWRVLATFLAAAALVAAAFRFHYGDMVRRARETNTFLSSDFEAVVERASGAAFGSAWALYALYLSGVIHVSG